MAGFKNPDLHERQEAAAKARKAALEKFLAKAADPALAERLTARTAGAAERKAVRTVREAEKAETKARDAERALKAERDAALQAERDKAERAEREAALQAKQKADRDARYAARKSKSKRK
jgi:predicted component of type VI protein secretion system